MDRDKDTSALSYEEFLQQRKERWERDEAQQGSEKFRYENQEWFYEEPEDLNARYEIRDKESKTVFRVEVLGTMEASREYWFVRLYGRQDPSTDLIPLSGSRMSGEQEFLRFGEDHADGYFANTKEQEPSGKEEIEQRKKRQLEELGKHIDQKFDRASRGRDQGNDRGH